MKPRFERKYRLTHATREFLLAYWGDFLAKAPFTNEHASYPVLSLYYDSPELVFHREKYAGIGYRRKVRLRTYGYRFRQGSTCFLEIKRRAHESVSKIRFRMDGFRRDDLRPDRWYDRGHPDLAPFLALREAYRLRPVAQVLYTREAYQGVTDPDLRLTFDSALTALHPGERFSRRLAYDGSRAVLPENGCILEIKGTASLPSWIRRGIRWAGLVQETVPKYVMVVDALGIDATGKGVHS